MPSVADFRQVASGAGASASMKVRGSGTVIHACRIRFAVSPVNPDSTRDPYFDGIPWASLSPPIWYSTSRLQPPAVGSTENVVSATAAR